MSNGVNFTNLPSWDEMDFSKNCTLFGNWLSSYLMPNPWDNRQVLGASFPLSLDYFLSATPDTFTIPSSADEQQALILEINEWFAFNLFSYVDDDGYWYLSDDFFNRAVWDPVGLCPAEYCKALGYTGNADLTGIGVSYDNTRNRA
jgi:hypothetical protein